MLIVEYIEYIQTGGYYLFYNSLTSCLVVTYS